MDDFEVNTASAIPQKVPGFERRRGDRSQAWRSGFQVVFLLLNLWIGVQFLLWVRHFESGGETLRVERPPGVEGWLPIASLMNLKAWILSGELPLVHPAGVFLLTAFLLIAFLIRKSFCSWLCPVGTISEALWRIGEKLIGRNRALPRWIDIPLRSLKYLLLGLFLYAVGSMSLQEIRAFLDGPYGIVADVKMLEFFRRPGSATLITIGILIGSSLVFRNFWCRYLCPYGALLGLVGLLSPVAIRRDKESCIDCGKCSKACPSRIPVADLVQIRSAECTACYSCVAACPSKGALDLGVLGGRRVPPAWAGTIIALVFLGLVAVAGWSDRWHTKLPDHVYQELVPRAGQFSHP